MRYHVKFGRSASNGVRINRREPQIGERWAPPPSGWEWLNPWKYAPHTCQIWSF